MFHSDPVFLRARFNP